MKKIVSFSLWGEDPKYTIGAIENAKLVNEIYQGWIGRFYCGKSVPENIINSLKNTPNTEVIIMDEDGDWTGMFWRFLACKDGDVMISRDTDSRLSLREKLAVDEWLKSDKDFHIMRDHPYHAMEILGGMWGCRNGILNDIESEIIKYNKGNFWQVDQNFLRDVIYPTVKNNSLVHDEFFDKKPFPTKREPKRFVGQAFNDKDELLHPEHINLI
jgi:hypothetical protein